MTAMVLALLVIGVTIQQDEAADLHAVSKEEQVRAALATLKSFDATLPSNQALERAIETIARHRVDTAVPELARLIAVRRYFSWERSDVVVEIQPITAVSRYPALAALIEVGDASLPALRRIVAEEEWSSDRARNARHAIELVYGERAKAGAAELRRFAQTHPGAQRARLLAVAACIADTNRECLDASPK